MIFFPKMFFGKKVGLSPEPQSRKKWSSECFHSPNDDTVKNCEGSEILPCLWATELAYHRFRDAGRRRGTRGWSQQPLLITAMRVSVFSCASSLSPSSYKAVQLGPGHTCMPQERNLELRKPGSFMMGKAHSLREREVEKERDRYALGLSSLLEPRVRKKLFVLCLWPAIPKCLCSFKIF